MPIDRLQKIIARAGVTSRRKAEEMILAGQVKVNGRVITELGAKADPARDEILVGGRPLPREARAWYVLNKPPGCVTTLHDPEGRPTIAEHIPRDAPRVYPVGRLDWDTAGILLLTNDGELAHRLTHPSYKVPKVYRARVAGHPTDETLQQLANGIELGDGTTAPAEVLRLKESKDSTWIRLIIHEGRNRQIKRMLDAVGHPVIKLRRDMFAGISNHGLRTGKLRPLKSGEVRDLRELVGLPASAPRGPRTTAPATATAQRGGTSGTGARRGSSGTGARRGSSGTGARRGSQARPKGGGGGRKR